MPRFIVAVQRGHTPICHYLSKTGILCHTAKFVATFSTVASAQSAIDSYHRQELRDRLTIEQLPPRLSLANALLRSKPIDEMPPPQTKSIDTTQES